MNKKKYILIHNIITPTRTKLFNELYKKYQAAGINIEIWFTQKNEDNRFWTVNNEIKQFKFPYRILDGNSIAIKNNGDATFFHISKNFLSHLNKENTDRIIHAGWAGISSFLACWRCIKNDKQFTLWSGSTKYEHSWRRSLTTPVVRWLVKNSTDYWSYGTRATEYLVSLGASEEKIFSLYNTVDVDYFLSRAKELAGKSDSLKKKYVIKEDKVILFVGQFIKRKGVYELLEGYKKYSNENKNVALVMVGGGPEEKLLQSIVEEESIDGVYFFDFMQKDQLCELYALSDIFILPSYEEVWGLVINEAMCFGLPVITSVFVGASEDLIIEDKSGYILHDVSSGSIVLGIKYIFDNGLLSKNFSKKIIRKFSIRNILSMTSIP